MNETVYETKVKGALKIKTLDDLNSKKESEIICFFKRLVHVTQKLSQSKIYRRRYKA